MNWISITQNPTTQDILYLFTDKGCYLTGYFHGENSGYITYGDEAYHKIGEITHWALPEPPKTL